MLIAPPTLALSPSGSVSPAQTYLAHAGTGRHTRHFGAMAEDLITLRDRAARARRLAMLATDPAAIAELLDYAVECEAKALDLETAGAAARDGHAVPRRLGDPAD
jgi:hypothetical protein